MNIQALTALTTSLIRRYSLWTFGLSCVLLSGCSATGPKFQGLEKPDSNTGEIVVYRPDRFVRGGVGYYVHLDGKEVGLLKNSGFMSLATTPGTHVVLMKAGFQDLFRNAANAQVTLDVGERKFLRFEPSITGIPIVLPNAAFVPVGFGFIAVPEGQAVVELQNLNQSK